MAEGTYEVRRSARRRRTMSIVREAGRLVVIVPAGLTRLQERTVVPPFVQRFFDQEKQRQLPSGDPELRARALELFDRYLADADPDFRPDDLRVRWSTRQQQRWGSATPAESSIRLSSRLQQMPSWVGDYVLVHELAHLIETHHTSRFHALVARYPATERAKGYLEGFSAAQGWAASDY